MKKILLLSTALCATASLATAQGAFDAYNYSQTDLKGTARFMSMGGAFGALGADLSTLSQNPGGIGVYRRCDIGFTVDIDAQSNTAKSQGISTNLTNTKFLLNNIGIVGTINLNSEVVPNINLGFTYNKSTSFNRKTGGTVRDLRNSMSNYVAGVSNNAGVTEGDVRTTNHYDPYYPNDGGFEAPWISILGYDSYLINPDNLSDNETHWTGQFGDVTTGSGWFSTLTSGAVDSYNISLGGNFCDKFFWGMTFDIIDFNYNTETLWGENLKKAYVADMQYNIAQTSAEWSLYNYLSTKGNGFNYKLGFIVKPIQELRLGFAFHTPTWYNMTNYFYGDVNYKYGNDTGSGTAETNNGYNGYNTYKFRTPWRLIASAAGVIGKNLIVSADYEWMPYNGMHLSDTENNGYFNYDNPSEPLNSYFYQNQDIKAYYKAVNKIRLGVEYRVIPALALRAGYSYVSSPVTVNLKNNTADIYFDGTRPQYDVQNATNYITCGLGYRIGSFYIDAAYVYKHQTAQYHPYAPSNDAEMPSPEATLSLNNHQVVLSAGFKF